MTDYNVKSKEENKIWAGKMAWKKWKSFGNMLQDLKKKKKQLSEIQFMFACMLSHSVMSDYLGHNQPGSVSMRLFILFLFIFRTFYLLL